MTADDILFRAPVALGPLPRAEDVYPLCAPALSGARTDLQDVDHGIVLDVTASDGGIAAAIRARAAALLSTVDVARHSDFDAPSHGGLAACPVVVNDTQVTAIPIDRGIRFIVTTSDDEVEWLRRETRARFAELEIPTPLPKDGLARCPNALPSAATSVHDVPGAVVITVVSKDAEVCDAIRARAWHLAAESRGEGAWEDTRSSARCPVVLGDVSVAAVDVPGGAEVTLRPESADRLDELRRTVRARSAAFP